jgi:hypothetical protein
MVEIFTSCNDTVLINKRASRDEEGLLLIKKNRIWVDIGMYDYNFSDLHGLHSQHEAAFCSFAVFLITIAYIVYKLVENDVNNCERCN